MSASEMAMEEVPDTLMIVSYVSQYHEVFKNETPGNTKPIYFFTVFLQKLSLLLQRTCSDEGLTLKTQAFESLLLTS